MPSHEFKLNAPGLKRRGKRKERLYWAARADIAKLGFTPRLVRLLIISRILPIIV